jgi:hypothetical protein
MDEAEDEGFLIPPALATCITEMAMDCSVIQGTRERMPVSRWTLFRWWCAGVREDVAGQAYRFIAGHDLPDAE